MVKDARGAAAVAVDWIRDRLYWSCPENRTLWRTSLEGSDRTLIIHDTGNITHQNNLVLDPREGYDIPITTKEGFVVTFVHHYRIRTLGLPGKEFYNIGFGEVKLSKLIKNVCLTSDSSLPLKPLCPIVSPPSSIPPYRVILSPVSLSRYSIRNNNKKLTVS